MDPSLIGNVVMLPEQEEREFQRLWDARREADSKLWLLSKQAREAVQARNATKRECDRLTKLWLPLAERKFGTGKPV